MPASGELTPAKGTGSSTAVALPFNGLENSIPNLQTSVNSAFRAPQP